MAAYNSYPATTPVQLEVSLRIFRILPDLDFQLTHPRVEEGHWVTELATQSGVSYEIHLRSRLDAAVAVPVEEVEGDGHFREFSLPVGSDSGFWGLRRR